MSYLGEMVVELDARTDGESAEGMVWIRPSGEEPFPNLQSGQEVVVALDGDPLALLGTVLDATDESRVLVLLDRVAMTEQVDLVAEEPRSPVNPPLVNPNAA